MYKHICAALESEELASLGIAVVCSPGFSV